jgi:hypothetical protein
MNKVDNKLSVMLQLNLETLFTISKDTNDRLK